MQIGNKLQITCVYLSQRLIASHGWQISHIVAVTGFRTVMDDYFHG